MFNCLIIVSRYISYTGNYIIIIITLLANFNLFFLIYWWLCVNKLKLQNCLFENIQEKWMQQN